MLDKVWFTYKARIQAYHRLEWMDTHSQFLLVWYAILGAALSVVVIRYPTLLGSDTDIFGAVLSIALLGVSLSVANRNFRGRAVNMRNNYLALQHLYNVINSRGTVTGDDIIKYDELLNEVDTHNDMDDKIFRVRNSSRLTSRTPNWKECIHVYAALFFKYIVLAFAYLAPFIVGWFLYE
ncbi:TPA: SLATT domain-containing protein [Yersinia enterocolitica]|nr:SLATT domain-containing protein [Yersinia enterocolitica]HDL6905132.1 SLATT domain-containing protein [Yersinia enterocolitica]HDL6909736.1 SLATT domain-containing protein [Yersinia enterocolitica]HDL7028113.1 SLATT domain-containing protein [Yersinia enterocolitica]HDL7036665.1 SLATT domain-containing protein [Yersinia enterocolitica]